ncbi:MAG: N-acetylmuramoyl-L-alanine amidase [Rhabdaerophilum calidifontis]
MASTTMAGARSKAGARFRAISAGLAALAVLAIAPALRGAEGNGANGPARGEPPAVARGLHLVDAGGEAAGLVVDLPREVNVRVSALAAPDRLVIDLDGVVIAPGVPPLGRAGQGPVAGYRAGLFMLGQSRIVVDLARPALAERVDFVRQAGTARLIVEIRAVTPQRFAEQARMDRASRLAAQGEETAAIARPPGAKPLIVIDPGHGGIDPGASGAKGELEKDIVLAFGRALRQAIEAEGRLEVQMTREDDRFIALGERVRFARSRGAALFVSLHADSLAGESDVRGASVYTLSEKASDAAAARAAEKENRADLMAGLDPDTEARDGIGDILADLARRETRIFNQLAARAAIGAIRHGAALHKVPLRSAGFRVLRAPDMPSILIELGYLSNAEDLAALHDDRARATLARTLARAFTTFLTERRDAISARVQE